MLFNSYNLKLKHPGSRKLLFHCVGPFTIERSTDLVAYRLQLLDSIYIIYAVIHVSKLMKYCTDGQCQPSPPLT